MADWWNPAPALQGIADNDQRRLNFIWKQLIDPCDAPFTVWMWSFWKALGHAFLGVVQIDVKQMIRSALRPQFRMLKRRGLAHWHGGDKGERPSKGKGRKWKVNLDYNDLVGREVAEFLEFDAAWVSDGELAFWVGIDVAELLFFIYFVWDLSLQFVYEGLRGVAESKYCQARDDAVLLAVGGDYPLLGIFGWDAMGPLGVEKQRRVVFFNGYGGSLEFGPAHVLATAFIQPGTPNATKWWMRLTAGTGPRAGLQREIEGEFAAGSGGAQVGIQVIGNGTETWVCEIKVGDACWIRSPTLSMHAVAPSSSQ